MLANQEIEGAFSALRAEPAASAGTTAIPSGEPAPSTVITPSALTSFTDYIVLKGSDNTEITEIVRRAMALGYEPWGALCVAAQGTGLAFFQTMVK